MQDKSLYCLMLQLKKILNWEKVMQLKKIQIKPWLNQCQLNLLMALRKEFNKMWEIKEDNFQEVKNKELLQLELSLKNLEFYYQMKPQVPQIEIMNKKFNKQSIVSEKNWKISLQQWLLIDYQQLEMQNR